jgi:hypothetical protein
MSVELANRENAAGGGSRNVRPAAARLTGRLTRRLFTDHVAPRPSALARPGLSVAARLATSLPRLTFTGRAADRPGSARRPT